MNINYPMPLQLLGLRALWKSAFDDTDSFLDKFFSTAFSPNRCRCVSLGGKVLAALYWFETTCQDRKFAYLYAVATDAACRNQGLCRRLIEDTKALLRAEGYAGILLVPEDEALTRMYAKMGFEPCTTVSECWITPGPFRRLPDQRLLPNALQGIGGRPHQRVPGRQAAPGRKCSGRHAAPGKHPQALRPSHRGPSKPIFS